MHMSFVYSLCRPLSQRNILDLKEQGIGTLAQTLKTAVPGGRPGRRCPGDRRSENTHPIQSSEIHLLS